MSLHSSDSEEDALNSEEIDVSGEGKGLFLEREELLEAQQTGLRHAQGTLLTFATQLKALGSSLKYSLNVDLDSARRELKELFREAKAGETSIRATLRTIGAKQSRLQASKLHGRIGHLPNGSTMASTDKASDMDNDLASPVDQVVSNGVTSAATPPASPLIDNSKHDNSTFSFTSSQQAQLYINKLEKDLANWKALFKGSEDTRVWLQTQLNNAEHQIRTLQKRVKDYVDDSITRSRGKSKATRTEPLGYLEFEKKEEKYLGEIDALSVALASEQHRNGALLEEAKILRKQLKDKEREWRGKYESEKRSHEEDMAHWEGSLAKATARKEEERQWEKAKVQHLFEVQRLNLEKSFQRESKRRVIAESDSKQALRESIASLQEELKALRQNHAAEVDQLRQELAQQQRRTELALFSGEERDDIDLESLSEGIEEEAAQEEDFDLREHEPAETEQQEDDEECASSVVEDEGAAIGSPEESKEQEDVTEESSLGEAEAEQPDTVEDALSSRVYVEGKNEDPAEGSHQPVSLEVGDPIGPWGSPASAPASSHQTKGRARIKPREGSFRALNSSSSSSQHPSISLPSTVASATSGSKKDRPGSAKVSRR